MVADAGSYSPSAAKPAQVVASWRRHGLALDLQEPLPVTEAQLGLAHDPAFVRSILDCRADNGFGNRSAAVAASLPYTSGAMLSAARHAIAHRTIAAAPCSGFHHARYDRPAGFCTFNGLMVAACALRSEGLAARVGILDCDMHYGDGTDEIIERLGATWIRHFTAGRRFGRPEQASRFLEELPAIARAFADCEIVLYQAGADPHVDDPLGGWLTTEELRRRDAIVFDTLAELEVPIAWNLAGGYQREADGSIPKVLEIHDNTAIECSRVLSCRDPRKPPR
jgi:acetoin utilization deacetylase AcuC-like enzyme